MAKPKKKKIVKKIIRKKVLRPIKKRKVLVVRKNKPAKKKIQKKPARKAVIKKVIKVKKVVKAKKLVGPKKKIAKKPIIKPIIKPVSKPVAKPVIAQPVTEFPAQSFFKAKIKVIGIGGGGGSIVSEIGRSLEKATFVIADTDIRALKKKSGIKYFWFGEELTHGLGTGVNVDLAKQAAEAAKEKMSGFFKDQDIIIFVASLGGGLGSGATQVFVDAAKEFGGITFGIFTLPFKFEGKNKYRVAQNALKSLRQSLNVSLVIPNERIFKVIDSSTPITNAFSTVNKSLMESLESLIDLIYNPGVINIDFADLRTILRGKGNLAFLNTVEESGKDRVEKICEGIFKNPLLQINNFKTEKILFNVAGSENLSMFEVEKISSHIASQNPKSKIIFGISQNSKLKNKVKTTILMTGAASSNQAEEKVIIKEEKVKEKPIIEEPVRKKTETKKQPKKVVEKTKEKIIINKKEPVSLVPVPEVTIPLPISLEQKMAEVQVVEKKNQSSGRQAIRRSGLEIRKAEELQEKRRMAQEKEWEIPAFLRKVKFKS